LGHGTIPVTFDVLLTIPDLPVFLGQMSLYVPVFMDGAPLMNKLLAKTLFQGLDDAFSSISDPEYLAGDCKTPSFQVR